MADERQQMDSGNQLAGNRGGNKLWADLLRTNSRPSKAFQLRKWSEEERDIAKEELRHLGFCLVGYILGRYPGRTAVENIRRSWNVNSSCSQHQNGWLIFSFSSAEDRDSVLMKGPYETFGAPWLLKKMPMFFKFQENLFTSVPTWIRLPGLPLECWTEIALGKLASFVGEPLAADECTAAMSKTSFARVLVEVDLSRPLQRKICARLPDGSLLEQDVVYEREPLLCSNCKRLGHNEDQCRSIRKKHLNAQNHKAAHNMINPSASSGHELAVLQLARAKGVEGSDAAILPSATPAATSAAELMHPQSAMMVQRRADLQGEASTFATSHTSAVNQIQNLELKSTTVQQLDPLYGASANTPANQHIPEQLSAVSQQAGRVINTPQVDITGQNKRQTRNASAVNQPAAACNLDAPMTPASIHLKINEHSSCVSQPTDPITDTAAKEIGMPCLQEPVVAPAYSPHANMNQQLTELQASTSSAGIAAEMVPPQPARMRQQMVDQQGSCSTPANPTAATQLLDQGLISDAIQLTAEPVIQLDPAQFQEQNPAAIKHPIGAVQEQTQQETQTGQTRRLTRNTSAVIAAVEYAKVQQPLQQGLAAHAETSALGCAQTNAEMAELPRVDSAATPTAVPRQQTGSKKWQTGKTRSGKQRR